MAEEQKELPIEQEVLYACPEFPNYTVHVTATDTLTAQNGLLRVPQRLVAAMALLAKRPDIRAVLKKINIQAGKDLVAADIANRRAAATKGPVTTDNSALSAMRQTAAETQALREAGLSSSAPNKPPATGVSSDPDQKQPGQDPKESVVQRLQREAAERTAAAAKA